MSSERSEERKKRKKAKKRSRERSDGQYPDETNHGETNRCLYS